MYQPPVPVTRKQVPAIVNATFPGYKGRKIGVKAVESVTFIDVNWSGGTRSQYRACALDGTPTERQPNMGAMPPWANPFEGKTVALPAGFVIVEHVMFCGKDLGLRIYVNPADMPKLLPAVGGA